MEDYKKFNGQIHEMGKGNKRKIPNFNSPQPKHQNYNSIMSMGNLSRNQVNFQMNSNNRINMSHNIESPKNYMKINNQNNYRQYKDDNKRYNNNHLINNAKMILSTNNNVSKDRNKNINNKKNLMINIQERNKSAIRHNQKNNINSNNVKPKLNNSDIINNKYRYIEFQPYSLRDYKELIRNKVVMGPLGANIGTEEWESKRNKMKKMLNYCNNISKEHTGIKSLKKYSPSDEIERSIKQNIENSIRYRANEYGKLVRAGDFNNDYNKNLNNGKNMNMFPDNDDDYYLKKYEDKLRNETENLNKKPKIKEVVEPVEESDNEEQLNLDELLKQKEAYKVKIQDIRDTLLE